MVLLCAECICCIAASGSSCILTCWGPTGLLPLFVYHFCTFYLLWPTVGYSSCITNLTEIRCWNKADRIVLSAKVRLLDVQTYQACSRLLDWDTGSVLHCCCLQDVIVLSRPVQFQTLDPSSTTLCLLFFNLRSETTKKFQSTCLQTLMAMGTCLYRKSKTVSRRSKRQRLKWREVSTCFFVEK